jgi:asparagine synthase (glutamine-hydrolysing)
VCGIAGLASPSLAATGEHSRVVEAMLARLAHRGPDGSGVAAHGDVALGSSRLTIIDLNEHALPLATQDGRFVISYNGEVYNHRQLRAELEAAGARFATHTDTEVVAEAWRAWGRESLSRLEGMYAFVILDRETGELFGARDRMGQKPLAYHHDGETFAYASFLPSFEELPGLALEPDPQAVFDVLELGYVLSPKTAYRQLRQRPPACGFRFHQGELEIFEYWSLAQAFREGAEKGRIGVAGAMERLDDRLRHSVRERLVADVPVGVLLSGGLDSSVIAALALQDGRSERVQSFSIGFEESGYDEREHAASVAAFLGTDHHAEVLKLDDPDQLLAAQEKVGEPLADTSVLPTTLVSRVARSRVKVALSGDGADELFAGYETFRADALRALLHRGAWSVLRPLTRMAAKLLPVDKGKVSLGYKAKRFVSGLDLDEVQAHYHWRALMDRAEALGCLLPGAREAIGDYAPAARFAELDAELPGLDLVNRCSYVDLRTYLLDDILVKVDRASMGCSLEARSPYLDHRVVELAARLPGNLKLRGRTTKLILRWQHAHELPRSVLERKKEGFSSPVAHWLTGSLRELFLDLATPERLAPLGIDAAAVRRMHGELERSEAFHAYKLWAVLVLLLWSEGTGSHFSIHSQQAEQRP